MIDMQPQFETPQIIGADAELQAKLMTELSVKRQKQQRALERLDHWRCGGHRN